MVRDESHHQALHLRRVGAAQQRCSVRGTRKCLQRLWRVCAPVQDLRLPCDEHIALRLDEQDGRFDARDRLLDVESAKLDGRR